MPQTCTVQDHVDRLDLEALAAQGVGARGLERWLIERYPTEGDERRLSRSALHRHCINRECGCRPSEGAKPSRPREVEGFHLDEEGNVVDRDGVQLIGFDDDPNSRFHRIAAALAGDGDGGGGDVVFVDSLVVENVGDVEELAKTLDEEIGRMEREASGLVEPTGAPLPGRGGRLDLSGTLRSWRNLLGSEAELRFVRELDRSNRIPVSGDWSDGAWRRRVRERIALLEQQARAAREQRQPLNSVAAKLQELLARIGPLSLALQDGSPDERAQAAFELDQVEQEIGKLQRQQQYIEAANEERTKQERERAANERKEKIASAKGRRLSNDREEMETGRMFAASLVTTVDAAATLLHLYAQRHDLELEISRLNGNGGGGSVGLFSTKKSALADLVAHAFATRGQLSPYFGLSRIQRGPLFTMLTNAIAELEARREREREQSDPEYLQSKQEGLERRRRMEEQQKGGEEAP